MTTNESIKPQSTLDVQTLLTDGTQLIGGEWVPARAGETIEVLNPATGEPIATVPRSGVDDIGDAVGVAEDALPHPVAIRSRLGRMERALALLSLGMMILVGYFALSLWRDDGMVAAQAPVAAPIAPSSSARGTVARGLGAAEIDASKTSAGPASGELRPGDRR